MVMRPTFRKTALDIVASSVSLRLWTDRRESEDSAGKIMKAL